MEDSLHLLLPAAPLRPLAPKSAPPTHLEKLSRQLTKHISNGDWDDPAFHDLISPYMVAHLGPTKDYSKPSARTKEQFIAHCRALTARYPEFRNETISVNVEGEQTGRAKVWLVVKILGAPRGTCRESIMVVHWRWVRDGTEKWELVWLDAVWGVNMEG